MLHYLVRYTHRVAISNHRLIAVTENEVTFRWKDYRHGSAVRLMTISAEEFLRRFCLHVLPKGFVRIRFYGFLAPRCRTEALPRCRQALGANPEPVPAASVDDTSTRVCPAAARAVAPFQHPRHRRELGRERRRLLGTRSLELLEGIGGPPRQSTGRGGDGGVDR